jgi:hypothetical protein
MCGAVRRFTPRGTIKWIMPVRIYDLIGYSLT